MTQIPVDTTPPAKQIIYAIRGKDIFAVIQWMHDRDEQGEYPDLETAPESVKADIVNRAMRLCETLIETSDYQDILRDLIMDIGKRATGNSGMLSSENIIYIGEADLDPGE